MTERAKASPQKREFGKATAFLHSKRITSATIRKVVVDDRHIRLTPAPDIGNSRWVVAMSQPRADGRAIVGLQEAGYAVFSPCLLRWVRTGFKQARRAFPLFPGYIFVGLVPGPQYAVTQCDKIASVISDRNGPMYVRRETIARLSDAMMRGEFDQTGQFTGIDPDNAPCPFNVGENVRITEGPFAGFSATVSTMLDHERVAVLLSILGAERTVAIDTNMLKGA